jgi:hypothetical protein
VWLRYIGEYAKKYYSHLARVNSSDLLWESKNAHFFIIKSYTEDDVHKSMKYQIWSSTPEGNKRLHEAYHKAVEEKAPVLLFFRYPHSLRPLVWTARDSSWESPRWPPALTSAKSLDIGSKRASGWGSSDWSGCSSRTFPTGCSPGSSFRATRTSRWRIRETRKKCRRSRECRCWTFSRSTSRTRAFWTNSSNTTTTNSDGTKPNPASTRLESLPQPHQPGTANPTQDAIEAKVAAEVEVEVKTKVGIRIEIGHEIKRKIGIQKGNTPKVPLTTEAEVEVEGKDEDDIEVEVKVEVEDDLEAKIMTKTKKDILIMIALPIQLTSERTSPCPHNPKSTIPLPRSQQWTLLLLLPSKLRDLRI